MGLTQDLYFERCGSSKNILGQFHVALESAGQQDTGNTLVFEGGRVHDSGIYGKWFIEGGHNGLIEHVYHEVTDVPLADASHVIIRGSRLVNGPAWAAGTAYQVGDIVRGVKAPLDDVHFKCVTAGTSGSPNEPLWGVGPGNIDVVVDPHTLTTDTDCFSPGMATKPIQVAHAGGSGPLTTTRWWSLTATSFPRVEPAMRGHGRGMKEVQSSVSVWELVRVSLTGSPIGSRRRA